METPIANLLPDIPDNLRCMKEMNIKYVSRVFLNQPDKDSPAYIRCQVGFSHDYDEYMITITDCTNRINLHGNYRNENSYKNALYKLDTMIQELLKMKNHLVQNHVEQVQHQNGRVPRELSARFVARVNNYHEE